MAVTREESENDFLIGKHLFCLKLLALGKNLLAFGNRTLCCDKQLGLEIQI